LLTIIILSDSLSAYLRYEFFIIKQILIREKTSSPEVGANLEIEDGYDSGYWNLDTGIWIIDNRYWTTKCPNFSAFFSFDPIRIKSTFQGVTIFQGMELTF
jgi:hypothetical protein